MAIRFERIKKGDVLIDSYSVGGIRFNREVRVLTTEQHGAMVSYAGATRKFWTRAALEKLRRSPVKDRSAEVDKLYKAGRALADEAKGKR